ncbi:hypothetical protein J3F83DRAFT_718345 [Trichoderma novae-zelandiae]
MAIESQHVALAFSLLFRLLQWALHILLATAYIFLSKWLEHIRNHDFDEQHRKIDRRYCLMAIVFYALAANTHLFFILKMGYHATTGHGPDPQEERLALRCPKSTVVALMLWQTRFLFFGVGHVLLCIWMRQMMLQFGEQHFVNERSYSIMTFVVLMLHAIYTLRFLLPNQDYHWTKKPKHMVNTWYRKEAD